MSYLNAELTVTLLNNEFLDGFFRSHFETAINDLQTTGLSEDLKPTIALIGE